jgi:alkaline phosphatase
MRLSPFAFAALLLTGCASAPVTPPNTGTAPTDRAKNVIFLVGAGMGINTLTAARIYSVGEAGDLTIDTLPESAFVKTWSNDAQATDGAAAMTAYMTGEKVNNGAGCIPGRSAPTLAELARAQGRAIGLVTTSGVTAPRPAAVYAHVCDPRTDSLAQANLDVVLGGGAQDVSSAPTLTDMTNRAIALLARRPNGFFLVIESGGIERALQASRARRALEETVAFDDALKNAIAQMQRIDPGLKNTLIVATADHDSSLLINGYSPRTGKTTATNPGVLGLVRNVGDNKIRLDKDGMPYSILGFGNGEHRVNGSRASAPALTDVATSADDYRQEAAIRMAPGAATSSGNDVYLGAIGAGAETFRGTIDNTRVFGLIKAAAGW